jgi:hypothetical protein
LRDERHRQSLSSGPPGDRRTPVRRRAGRPLLPQVLQLAVTIVALYLCWQAAIWVWERTEPKEVSVPEVVGLAEAEANKVLGSLGLQAEVVARRHHEELPEGAVTAAEPPSGRKVKEGRVVRLTVSSGSRWAVVPDVRDMSVDRARALVKEARLTIGRERTRYHDQVPIGYVVGQAPEPEQKVPRGTAVDIWMSKGPPPQTDLPTDRPVPGQVRSTEVELTVPPGAELQEVRIEVQDRHGKQIVYQAYHEPGEQIKQTVSGEGNRVVVRVYLSGLLAQEHSL